MQKTGKASNRRESLMSPTMQGAHCSVKMPQLQPQRASIPGNMRPHTASISMYSHGNDDDITCKEHFLKIIFFQTNKFSFSFFFTFYCLYPDQKYLLLIS